MDVNVGQVVFVLNAKNRSLLPAQVNEVVVSKKVEGETIQHILMLQNGKKLILEKLTTPWFTELSSAKDYLLSEAEKMIDMVIDEASLAATTHFEAAFDTAKVPYAFALDAVNANELDPENPDKITVDLGDGKTARVTLPKEFSVESTSG